MQTDCNNVAFTLRCNQCYYFNGNEKQK